MMCVCSGVETKAYVIQEKNISFDLPGATIKRQGFNVSGAMFYDSFEITKDNGVAYLYMYTVGSPWSYMSSEAITDFLVGTTRENMENEGYIETGNWTSQDHSGKSVTVYNYYLKGQLFEVNLAIWPLEGKRFAELYAILDRDSTNKIINTLKVE
ncbi:MAG: hypothetical protein QFX31_07405 [Methanothrix sp.]|uniref:hypothetical protein n=1 Tax=Methanothrix sp. TaxID=90426 RepID=UPI0032AF76EA|nr:hypothetical protein [Methanothrix sp.]